MHALRHTLLKSKCCAVVAPQWLSRFPLQERIDLFHSFFAQAPADVLLAVLVTYVLSASHLALTHERFAVELPISCLWLAVHP